MNRTELGDIVTDCLVAMVTGVTGMVPPKGEAIPGFIQGPIDRATDRIFAAIDKPAEQNQGEPVCWVNDQQLLLCSQSPRVVEPENPMMHNLPRNIAGSALHGEYCNTPLFRHADSGEVVALRGAYLRAGEREHELRKELAQLRAALKFYADRDHYSTDDGSNWDSCSGEPANILWHESEPWFIEDGSIARSALTISAERGQPDCVTCNGEGAVGNILDTVPCPDCAAPTDHEDPIREALRAFVGAAYPVSSQINERGHNWSEAYLDEALVLARTALEHKPSALVDQLQADLTALDEKLDQTQDLLRCMVYDYRSVVQAGYDRITALGSDCDSVAKMLDDNPNYQKALALLLPDLESRPEERGTPETEPCSGCGTPGWTGACTKCVPY